MRSELFHIYGPFSIQSYGLFIVIGLIAFIEFVKRDARFAKLGIKKSFTNIVLLGAAIGLLGGRLLYLFTETEYPWCLTDFYSFWNGGFSVLGGVIALTVIMPVYLHYRHIPVLAFADLIAVYVPLMLAICRIGCFFAGCCYGTQTSCWWGVCYTDATSSAPLFISMHPTQLYSALALFALFLLFYFVLRTHLTKPGQLLSAYLLGQGIERFVVDFWRADRITLSYCSCISFYQLIALALIGAASVGFIIASCACKPTSPRL